MPEFIVELDPRGDSPAALQARGGSAAQAPVEALPVSERAARVELRRQIGRLEAQLGELFSYAFPRAGIRYDVVPAGGPRILGIGELEEVRDRLLRRIDDVRSILSDRHHAEERNRELLRRVIAEPERYRWVRISNEDIGEPGCRHWHSKPRWGLLGMLMGWWRVKVSSGCPLARPRRRG
jgi:hypothetical protein